MTTIKQAVRSSFSRQALVATAVAAVGSVAHAQEGLTIEEIIVTATRRAESVQDIPLTVNVLSGQALEERGVSNFSEISALAPNVVWSDAGGGTTQNRITVRGIFSNATSQGFDPGVGIYIDDVYVGNQFGFNAALLDIERIEILKGPQGTLFGRNTSAGAIAIHTRRPSLDEATLDTSLKLGNLDLVEARASGNLPIGEIAALKVSGLYRDRDGYQRNVVTGKRDLNDENAVAGRAQLLIEPSAAFDMLLTGEYFKNDDHQDIYSCVDPATGPFAGICAFNPTRQSVEDDLAADNNSINEREMWSLALRTDWRMGGGYELTTITAYRDLTVHVDQDQDYVALDLVRSGYDVPKDRQFSEEVRLATPADERLRGVVGLYYFNEDRRTIIPQIFTPLYIALQGLPPPSANVVALTDSTLETTNWAVFGQGQFDIIPSLTLELGVRYSDDEKQFQYQQAGAPGFGIATVGRTSADAAFDAITYTGSLNWAITDNLRTYVRYATGYKSGGFQSAVTDTSPTPFNPLMPFDEETSDQWEVGLKSSWLDQRLRANIAAFRINYEDIQQQILIPLPFPPGGFNRIVGNFGTAESEGAELELSFAALASLSLEFNAGYQDARYTEGPLAGRRIQYSPRKTAAASVSYRHGLWAGASGLASVSASYRDGIALNTNAPGSPNFLSSPHMTTVNARVGVELADTRWGVYLWGDNLTDERRFTNFTPGTVHSFHITPPITYGVEMRARF